MKRPAALAVLIQSGLFLSLAAAPAAQAEGLVVPEGVTGPARQDALEHLVHQDCGACHGMTLKGGLGSPLLPQDLAGRDDADLAAVILDGRPGTPMPPWRGLLSDGDVRWIVHYLKEGGRD